MALKFFFAMDNFPLYGTSESFEFAKRLMKRGHEVSISTSSKTINGDKRSARMIDGLPVQFLPSIYLPQIPYVVTPSSPFALRSTIKHLQPDVAVCVHLVHFTTNAAVLAARWNSVPVLLGIRGPRLGFGSSFPNASKTIWEKTVARLSIQLSNLIFFDCVASYNSVKERGKELKSTIIYSGVDTSRFVPARRTGDNLVVTFVGSLTPTKGVNYLIDAIPSVLRSSPDARFLIVGEGMQRGWLETRAKHLGVQGKVSFLGYRNDIPRILRESDIFVLPSVSEGVSLSLLQAASAGKAIVASNVGGSPEVIDHGHDGFLAAPFSPDSLAQGIRRLALDSDLREEFGRRIREKVVKKFDWEPLTDQLERAAKNLVGGNQKS